MVDRSPRATGASRGIPSLFAHPRLLALNALIVVLAVTVGYLAYALFSRHVLNPPVDSEREGGKNRGAIQLDVLNGCGASGAANVFTSYLRARGYDVVEMRNYRSFDVEHSLVVDRTGDMENARKVAYALGIAKQNIVRQINEGYYVDVSVVIGKDFQSLKPSQEERTH
jgi:hypothetical protein